MSEYEARFEGIRRLYGADGAERLRQAHICVVGLGGVGSWALEALARCGIGMLSLIDFDDVCVSNINRQLPASSETLGRTKASVMRARVLSINPECNVHAHEEFFTESTAGRLLAPRFDCILDAIDNVPSKCLLIAQARQRGIRIIASGGAGGRKNPTKIRVTDLSCASHDRLLQRVRKILRKEYGFPHGEEPFGVPCVHSNEQSAEAAERSCAPGDEPKNCNQYGTVSFVTGSFGLAAASEVVRSILEDRNDRQRKSPRVDSHLVPDFG